LVYPLDPAICYNAIEDRMSQLISHIKQSGGGKGLRRKLIPLLVLLLVIAIWVGIFYLYQRYPGTFDELKAYGYLGAFLLSLIFNATVILPVGAIGTIFALGAVLPMPVVVGLAGGVGAAIGEITGYMAGYSGRGIAQKSQMYSRMETWVRRWGWLAIFVFSIVPFAFDLVGIAAGVLRFPFWKFLFFCWLGRTILYIGAALAGAWGWGVLLPSCLNF
jgi:membrane protein YqaA with SNARE-associated domain